MDTNYQKYMDGNIRRSAGYFEDLDQNQYVQVSDPLTQYDSNPEENYSQDSKFDLRPKLIGLPCNYSEELDEWQEILVNLDNITSVNADADGIEVTQQEVMGESRTVIHYVNKAYTVHDAPYSYIANIIESVAMGCYEIADGYLEDFYEDHARYIRGSKAEEVSDAESESV